VFARVPPRAVVEVVGLRAALGAPRVPLGAVVGSADTALVDERGSRKGLVRRVVPHTVPLARAFGVDLAHCVCTHGRLRYKAFGIGSESQRRGNILYKPTESVPLCRGRPLRGCSADFESLLPIPLLCLIAMAYDKATYQRELDEMMSAVVPDDAPPNERLEEGAYPY